MYLSLSTVYTGNIREEEEEGEEELFIISAIKIWRERRIIIDEHGDVFKSLPDYSNILSSSKAAATVIELRQAELFCWSPSPSPPAPSPSPDVSFRLLIDFENDEAKELLFFKKEEEGDEEDDDDEEWRGREEAAMVLTLLDSRTLFLFSFSTSCQSSERK